MATSYDTLKRATPEEEQRIIEQLKRDAKATIIEYLDVVMPERARDGLPQRERHPGRPTELAVVSAR
jgi:tRNA A37 N6-isopentenylltransferase MiaA